MLKQMSGAKMYEQGKEYEVNDAKGERLIFLKCAEEVKTKKDATKKISNNGSTVNRTNNTKRSKGTSKK